MKMSSDAGAQHERFLLVNNHGIVLYRFACPTWIYSDTGICNYAKALWFAGLQYLECLVVENMIRAIAKIRCVRAVFRFGIQSFQGLRVLCLGNAKTLALRNFLSM